MKAKEAVTIRIRDLCEQRGIKLNALADISGITASAIYSMFDADRKDVGVVILKKICDGFEISLNEFFNDDIFLHLEEEIKQQETPLDNQRCW